MSGISDSSLNNLLTSQNGALNQDIDTVIQKTKYISQSYASIMAINKVLFFVYICLFIILLVGFFIRLNRYGYMKLNLKKEALLFIGIILFPFIADSIEKFVYSFVMYAYSLITGTVFINRFDKLFNKTDFYYNPHK